MKDLCFFFDFDGVIVDSIDTLNNLYYDILKKYDIISTQADFVQLNGAKLYDIVKYIAINYDLREKENDIYEAYQKGLDQLYSTVKLNEGVYSILHFLKENNINIALVSSAPRSMLVNVCRHFDIFHYFKLIVSGEDVETAKPSAAIYQYAKSKIKDCIYFAIEDSHSGILSSKTAGDIYVVYYNKQRLKNLKCISNAHYMINSFDQIKLIVTGIYNHVYSYGLIAANINNFIQQDSYCIDEPYETLVNNIWSDAIKKNSWIFNDKIVCYKSHIIKEDIFCLNLITCEYKYFYAKLNQSLVMDRPIRPIGVSGIIIDENQNTIVGTRGQVSQYKGYVELIPSGSLGLDNKGKLINPIQQIEKEFVEECGLDKNIIIKSEVFCFIYDEKDQVFDIGIKIYVKDSLHKWLGVSIPENSEYTKIQATSIEELIDNCLHSNYQIVPVSYALLSNL